MTLQVSINVTGTQQEIKKLQALGQKFMDFTEANRQMGDELVSYYSGQAFASQGGVFGNNWPSLSPMYARRKARMYPGRGILELTGKMRKSYRRTYSKTVLIIDNTDPKFPYHQSTAPRLKMPWRPTLGINDDVKGIIKTVIDADIKKKIASVG